MHHLEQHRVPTHVSARTNPNPNPNPNDSRECAATDMIKWRYITRQLVWRSGLRLYNIEHIIHTCIGWALLQLASTPRNTHFALLLHLSEMIAD